MYIGVGVGWQRRCKPCQSLRVVDNQVLFFIRFVFSAVAMMVVELDHIVRGGEPQPRTRGMIACSVNMVRHPPGRYILISIAVSEVATPENK